MPTLQDKLAESLAALKKLQDKGIVAIQTKNLTRTHRERLVKNGFIKEVMKGWYIPTRPEEPAGESTVAGRLAGAFRNIGKNGIADNIIEAMRAAGYSITENDPFEETPVIIFSERALSPYVNRMRMHWADMRGVVLKNFPPAPLLHQTTDEYLKHVDEIYLTDAYHSLSIEGYHVSEVLIERVRSGNWDPETSRKDTETAAWEDF
jgi:hypothetical protein